MSRHLPSLLAPALLSLSGCGDATGPDWLIAEAVSPDGGHVARLWCPDRCDVPGTTVLTVSPGTTDVAMEPSAVKGFPAEGDLPETDEILRFHAAFVTTRAQPDGVETRLAWSGTTRLRIAAACPHDVQKSVAHKPAIAIDLGNAAPAGTCRRTAA